MLGALTSLWSRRRATPHTTPLAEPAPNSFAIADAQKLLQVSMNDTLGFVDIAVRPLSYAEAASSAPAQQAPAISPVAPVSVQTRRCKPGRGLLVPDDDDVPPERFKTNNYFLKNKVYKLADRARR